MKPRLVLWGNDAQNARVLIAMELRPDDNKVNLFTFPEDVVTEEFHQKMMDEWRDGKVLDFPEGYTTMERELTVTESLLPEELKVERGDVVQRAQTEWHFMVLSAKLNEAYQDELAGLKERIERTETYDNSLWTELKNFWDKVQNQVRDRNLLRSHSDALRNSTNELFDYMKRLRSQLDAEFDRFSTENYDRFINAITEVEKKISDGMRLAPIFDQLKEMQRNFKDAKLSREHRAKVWDKLDAAFKIVKEKRFGPETGGNSDSKSPTDRLQHRYDGLMSAIQKMERSIDRDRDDLEFQSHKIERTDGQLEAQIRQAKMRMIEERVKSKEEKLNEMVATRADLEQRIEQQRRRQAERDKVEEAKRTAQTKIAQDMKERGESVDPEKVARAVGAVQGTKPPRKDSSQFETLGEKLQAVLENAIDTTKAVGIVAQERLGDLLEDAGEVAKNVASAAEERIENVVEQVKETVGDYFNSDKDTAEETTTITDTAAETLDTTDTLEAEDVVPVVEEPTDIVEQPDVQINESVASTENMEENEEEAKKDLA